jgi:hypothetical protein
MPPKQIADEALSQQFTRGKKEAVDRHMRLSMAKFCLKSHIYTYLFEKKCEI